MDENVHQREVVHNVILQHGAVLQELADACRSDEGRLRELEERPKEVLQEHGIPVPGSVDVSVVFNTRDTFHFAMPPDPNREIDDEELLAVAGGKTAGTASSAGSVGSFPSCVSSVSSLGSASSQDTSAANAEWHARMNRGRS